MNLQEQDNTVTSELVRGKRVLTTRNGKEKATVTLQMSPCGYITSSSLQLRMKYIKICEQLTYLESE